MQSTLHGKWQSEFQGSVADGGQSTSSPVSAGGSRDLVVVQCNKSYNIAIYGVDGDGVRSLLLSATSEPATSSGYAKAYYVTCAGFEQVTAIVTNAGTGSATVSVKHRIIYDA